VFCCETTILVCSTVLCLTQTRTCLVNLLVAPGQRATSDRGDAVLGEHRREEVEVGHAGLALCTREFDEDSILGGYDLDEFAETIDTIPGDINLDTDSDIDTDTIQSEIDFAPMRSSHDAVA